jgi:hypothetical protein
MQKAKPNSSQYSRAPEGIETGAVQALAVSAIVCIVT